MASGPHRNLPLLCQDIFDTRAADPRLCISIEERQQLRGSPQEVAIPDDVMVDDNRPVDARRVPEYSRSRISANGRFLVICR